MSMLSIDDVAAELGISRRGVRRLISSGELRAYRIGAAAVRIKRADVEKALRPVVPTGGNK